MRLTWDEAEEIGFRLSEAHARTDPLSLSFTKLHALVVGLEGFEDDHDASDEGKLEAIQMAWYEELQEN